METIELLIKSSSALIGGLLSGIIALIIFNMTKRKEKQNKIEDSHKSLEIIQNEIEENRQAAKSALDFLTAGNIETIASLIESDTSTQENLISIPTNFSTEFIDKLVGNLSKNDYLLVVKDVKTIKMIISSLDILTNRITEVDAIENILKRIILLLERLLETEESPATVLVEKVENNITIKHILKNAWSSGNIIVNSISLMILVAVYLLTK